MSRSQTTPRIFISHSHLDEPFVRRLSETLSLLLFKGGLGVDIVSGTSPPLGSNWLEFISEEILKSDAVIFVISHNSSRSNWLSYESGLALAAQTENDNPLIVPVLRGSIEDMPSYLRQFQAADFQNEQAFNSNAQDLANNLLGRLSSRQRMSDGPTMAFDSKEGLVRSLASGERNFADLYLDIQRKQLSELRQQQERIEQTYYKDGLRKSIALFLLVILITELIAAGGAIYIYRDIPDKIGIIKDWFGLIFAPTAALVGTALGFYFGQQSVISK